MSNVSCNAVFDPGDVVYFYFPHTDTCRRCPGTECTYEKLYGGTLPEKRVLLVMEGKERPMLVIGRDGSGRYTLLKIESLKEKHKKEPNRFLAIHAGNLGKPSVVRIGVHFCLPGQVAMAYRPASIERWSLRHICEQHRALLGYGPPPPVSRLG